MKPELNKKAPQFSLNDTQGKQVSLKDFLGKKVIIFFYPKDDTPGCTKEACEFRDNFASFQKLNVELLGISPDDERSHLKFINKYELPLTLLCDTERKVAELYEVYKEKNMYGKKVMGIERSTFIVDESGVLIKEFRKVKVDGHIEKLLLEFA